MIIEFRIPQCFLFNAVGASFHSSSEHGISKFRSIVFPAVSTSDRRFGLIDPNLFLLLRRYAPVAHLPSLSPSSSVLPSTGRLRGHRFKSPNQLHCSSVVRALQFCHLQFLLCSYLRIMTRSPPTLTSSTRVVSSDLPPHFDHFPIFPEFRPTLSPELGSQISMNLPIF